MTKLQLVESNQLFKKWELKSEECNMTTQVYYYESRKFVSHWYINNSGQGSPKYFYDKTSILAESEKQSYMSESEKLEVKNLLVELAKNFK